MSSLDGRARPPAKTETLSPGYNARVFVSTPQIAQSQLLVSICGCGRTYSARQQALDGGVLQVVAVTQYNNNHDRFIYVGERSVCARK